MCHESILAWSRVTVGRVRGQRSTRIGWVAGAASGVVALLAMSLLVGDQAPRLFTVHTDAHFADQWGRVSNLANLRATGDICVPFSKFAFTYPPGAILFFWPIQWIRLGLLIHTWTLFSLAALAVAVGEALHAV